MGRSFQCRYVSSSAVLILTALMVMHPHAAAASPPSQGQDIAAALRQLDALDRLIQNSETSTVVAPGQRYYLDYTRLRADVARVRVGLQDYLTPPVPSLEIRSKSSASTEPSRQRASPAIPIPPHERRPALGVSGQQRYYACRDDHCADRHGVRRSAAVGRMGDPHGLCGLG